MKTYIQTDENGTPTSVYRYESSEIEESALLLGTYVFDLEASISDYDIITEYRIIQGNLIHVGKPPLPYMSWDADKNQWFDPRTPETEWPLVRVKRDRLLQSSDWTQLPDVPLATKEAWAAYRQALRDVTLQPDPFNITWPQPPQ